MHSSPFIKFVSYVLLISFLNLTFIQTVHGMEMDRTDSERRRLLSSSQESLTPSLDDDATGRSSAPSVAVPIFSKTTLLDLISDNQGATEELRQYVASLPPGVRAELRTFQDLQEYVQQFGPTGTTIKWTVAMGFGTLQAAGGSMLFFVPSMGGLLNAPPESPTSPPNPRLIGYSALAGVFTLPDTILGTEHAALALIRAFQDERLLKYMKKKGTTHVVIRGVMDGVGTSIFVAMTLNAFIGVIQGSAISPAVYIILGTGLVSHQVYQSAQIIDGKVMEAMRFVRDQKSSQEVLDARKYFDDMTLDAFRMSIQERSVAKETMAELRALRTYVQEALAELEAKRKDFQDPGDYLAARQTLQAFGALAELGVLRSLNPDHKYAPPVHVKKWYEGIPFIGRLLGPHSNLNKTVYGLFGLFAVVGSYITDYGYAWILGEGGLGWASTTAYGLAGPITAIFTIFFMGQLGWATANVINSAMGHNTAMDVNRIEQTHVGSKSTLGRVGRTMVDFSGLVASGFKTLFKTASAANGAGYLYGNTPEDLRQLTPGVVALGASNGAVDHNVSGTRLQQTLSRFVEWKHGSGAQALTDYIARMREGIADMNNDDVLALRAALDGFHDLAQRLMGEHDLRKKGETPSAEQGPLPMNGDGKMVAEDRKASLTGHDGGLPASVQLGDTASGESLKRTTPPKVHPDLQSEAAMRRDRQQEAGGIEMSMMNQLRQPLLDAEAASKAEGVASSGGLRSKVSAMVSSVWSKVTRQVPPPGEIKDI